MKIDKRSVEYFLFQPIKINKTFWVVLLIICSLSAGAFSFYKAVRKVGKPFQSFFVGANLMVSVGQRASWPGVLAGLKPLDKILEINGRPLTNIEEFRNIVGSARIGEVLRYTIDRGGEKQTISVPIKKISALDFLIMFLAPFSIGLIFITLGAFTLFYVPNLRVSYIYFILCSLIGIFCLILYESYTSHTFFRFTQIYPLMAAVSVHLFSIFPERKRITEWRSFTIMTIYLVAISLVGLREYFLFNQDISIALSKISSFFVIFTLFINLGLLVDTMLKAETNVARDRAKVLLAGLVIASSAVGLWSMNFIFKRALFFLDEAIIISLIFPIFMSYAILKKNIFDIDHVIRVSLTYASATGLVILGYFIVIAMVSFIWPGFLTTESLIGVFAILAIIGAFIFNPLKRKIRVLIYKLLFRMKYDRLQKLMEYGKRLSAGADIDEISRLLVSDLMELMDLKGALLITYTGEAHDSPIVQRFSGINLGEINLSSLDRSDSALVRSLSSFDRPQFLSELKNIRTARDVDKLKSLGIKILVPIKSKGELLGILFLMQKRSEDIFIAEDLEFLEALSNQAAVSLENARLYIDKAKQERLAAIGQVASVIIHEIKNPLGVIKTSSGTIKRRFKGGENIHELATFIEKEVDRVNSTIQQILNFAKPKENRLEEFILDSLVFDTIRAMEHESPERGIKLIPDLRVGDERIVADPEKLRRALINLLLNAKQAVKDGSEIIVKTAIVNEGKDALAKNFVEIEIIDRGEGIDETDMKYMFQPFYTTRQEGTGLGLSIVKQIAVDHGGTVSVNSKKGEGSTFKIRFPMVDFYRENGGSKWRTSASKEL